MKLNQKAMKNIMMVVAIQYSVLLTIVIPLVIKELLLPFTEINLILRKLQVLMQFLIQPLKQWHMLQVSSTFYHSNKLSKFDLLILF